MTKPTNSSQDKKSALAGQLIVSTVALGIMGFGAWSLLGQKAPYHPEVYENEVSRDSGSEILGVSSN